MQHWIVFLHILHVQLNQCGLALQWRTVIHDRHPLADAAASANSGVLLLDDECLLLFEAPKIQLRIIPFPWLLELNGHGARLAVFHDDSSSILCQAEIGELIVCVENQIIAFCLHNH